MTGLAALELSQIPMSQALASTLARASEGARATASAEVTLEHLLAALCDDPDAADVLAASQIEAMALRAEVIGHIARQAIPGARVPASVTVSDSVKRILEAAAAAARGGRRRDINGAIVLAAIVGDGRSAAAQMLQARGLTFDGAIRALQAAMAQPPRSTGGLPGAQAEDVLARARERVQSRSAPSLRDIMREMPAASRSPAPTDLVPAPVMPLPETAPVKPAMPPPAAAPERAAFPATAAPPAGAPPPAPPFAAAPASKPDNMPIGTATTPAAAERDARPGISEAEDTSPRTAAIPSEPQFAPVVPVSAAAESVSKDPTPAPELSSPKPLERDENKAPESAAATPMAQPAASPAPRPTPPPIPPPIPRMPPVAQPYGAPPLPGARLSPSGPPAGYYPPLPPAGFPQPPPQSDGYAMPPPRETRMGGPQPPVPPNTPGQMPPGQTVQQPAAQRVRPRNAGRAEMGELAENIPRAMRAGRSERVEVRIARGRVKALTEGLEGGGLAWRHDVVVTKAMSVRLRAPEGGFFIETVSPETQWVDSQFADIGEEFASWRFTLTPSRRGRTRLQIIVSARTVGADGVAAETAFPDQVVEVKVRSDLARQVTRVAGWIVAAVAGGALAKFGETALQAGIAVIARLSG